MYNVCAVAKSKVKKVCFQPLFKNVNSFLLP